jgi:peptide/nickel transport system ATP-binding protein
VPQPSSMPALVFQAANLAVSFPGGVDALRGIDIDVSPGEIVGIVGESGSGKSVLGLAALGLLSHDAIISGTANLAGSDMAAGNAEQRRLARRDHAGAVFQDPMTSLNPTKRVGAQLMEVCDSRAFALELLDEVNVPEPARRFDQFPHELSGGLRQRVMIAMAVARRPTLVVADEPTTALDVTVQAEIMQLFCRLRDDMGVAFLVITHDLALASQISDRVVVMYGGRVAEVGPTEEIVARARHPYSAALLHSRLTLHTDMSVPLQTLPGEPPDPSSYRAECPFVPRCCFAQDVCRDGLPLLTVSTSPTHQVACVRADDIDPRAVTSMDGGDAAGSSVRKTTSGHTLAAVVQGPGSAWSRRARRGQKAAPSTDDSSDGAVLVVRNVAKSFGAHAAVKDVSFSIAPGESLALVGESGCGKTTTLRMVVGLERKDRGEIRVAPGARTQMIFQDVGASLTPWMTVRKVLQERLRYERIPRDQWDERIEAVLALTGLRQQMLNMTPARLSGGQRQRVALARAVIVTPPLLVCDEPTSALDVSLASTALNLLNGLRRDLGMSMLIVTHDFAVARATADHILVMHDGEIIERGDIHHVLTSPATAYTRQLLAAVPTIDGEG